MANPDSTEGVFRDIDTNRDGVIDRRELHNYATGGDNEPGTQYEAPGSRYGQDDVISNRPDHNRYPPNYTSPSYGNTTNLSDFIKETVIHSSNIDETRSIIDRTPNIYKDPNPEIIRRTMECPIRHEQRIFLRCLQPPAQEPGPLIIKEVRPPQPPPLPPLIIREEGGASSSQAPIILREQPPKAPQAVASETQTRYLPPIPVPPRSVIIERFPPLPDRPRDIIIERWLPYPSVGQRRTIVEPAAPAIRYPDPYMQIICYQGVKSCVMRRFLNLGVVHENPRDYEARYGSSLLDRATLERRAREAGVVEDINCPTVATTKITNVAGSTFDSGIVRQPVIGGGSSAIGMDCEELFRTGRLGGVNASGTTYSSSTGYTSGGVSVGHTTRNYTEYRADESTVPITSTNYQEL